MIVIAYPAKNANEKKKILNPFCPSCPREAIRFPINSKNRKLNFPFKNKNRTQLASLGHSAWFGFVKSLSQGS